MKRAHTIYKNHSILVGNTVQIYKRQPQLRTTETDKYLQRFPKVRTGRSAPVAPWLDRLFWKWNRLFPRVFDEKRFSSCMLSRICLTTLDSFLLIKSKILAHYDENGLAGQFSQMESPLNRLIFYIFILKTQSKIYSRTIYLFVAMDWCGRHFDQCSSRVRRCRRFQ